MKKDSLMMFIELEGGRTTTKAARAAGFPNTLLTLLEREGKIERESRGVWALSTVPLDDYAVVALRWPRLVFCDESALFIYGLIDRTPAELDVACPQGYNAPAIGEEFPGVRIRRYTGKRFELGICKGLSPTGTEIALYDRERCVCDLLARRRRGKVDVQTFSTAVRTYLGSRDKDLPKLARYAQQLGVANDLTLYTEVLI